MGGKTGRTLSRVAGAAAGFALGGPVGAAAGFASVKGQQQGRQERKQIKQIAEQHRIGIDEQNRRIQTEQTSLNSRLDQSRKRLALGMSRANRSRMSGGLFGESGMTQTPLQNRLG